MKVKKPIFVIGSGRSGSTFFTKTLSLHPNIAFLSPLCEKYPTKPWLNRMIMHTMDNTVLQRLLQKWIPPEECWSFWRHYGIAGVHRDLFKEDVTIKMKSRLQNVMGEMLTKKRDRLLIHLTGWPRIGFLKEIFPDAKFIIMLRDGRAVVNSLLNNVDWWEGWLGPNRWGWGELTSEQKKEWEKYNKSFVALTAIWYKMILKSIEEAKKHVPPSDFFELKYEDLCADSTNVFQQVIDFCKLNWSSKFSDTINRFSFKNMNYKWKQDLTEYQKKILCECLHGYSKRYGYYD